MDRHPNRIEFLDITGYITDKSKDFGRENRDDFDYASCDEDNNDILGNAGSILIALFFVIVIIFLIHKAICKKNNSEYSYYTGVDGLTEAGWVAVVSDGCPWCVKQKEIIKTSQFSGFNSYMSPQEFVQRFNKESGFDGGVPYWYNTRLKVGVSGMQTLQRLEAMATAR